jgi:hypothetical protein
VGAGRARATPVPLPGSASCVFAHVDRASNLKGCRALRGVSGASGWANELQARALSPDGRSLYVAVDGKAVGAARRGEPARASALVTLSVDATSGALRQLPDRAGCLSTVPLRGCRHARGLDDVQDVLVAPDGHVVYTASAGGRALATFARDAGTGSLTQLPGGHGCLRGGRRGNERCRYVRRLGAPGHLSIAPDGRQLYAFGLALPRSATGAVTVPERPTRGWPALNPPLHSPADEAAAFLPATNDGYTFDGYRASVVAVRRDPATGALSPLPGQPRPICVLPPRGCSFDSTQALGIEVAPDGLDVFVTLGGDDAIVVLRRDRASGALTLLPARATCGGRSSKPPCRAITGGLDDVALTPDGRRLFAIFDDGIIAYQRDLASGALTPLPWPEGCLDRYAVRDRRRDARVDGWRGIVRPDGRFLYMLRSESVNAYAVG